MKKYRVTKKHEFYKVNTILKPYGNCHYHTHKDSDICFHVFLIKEWLKNSWIKEIQEPEFTKDDMKSFGAQCALEWQEHKLLYTDNELDKFIKNK